MSSRERLADRFHPGEGGPTGHTRARRRSGPTRRLFGLPRRRTQEAEGAGSGSLLTHRLNLLSSPPLSEVLDRLPKNTIEALAPHLLEVREAREVGEAPVSVKELVRAVEKEVKRQMPPFRLDGFEMKRRRPKRKEEEQKPQEERKKRKRRSRRGGRADAPRREPGKKQKKHPS